MLLDGASISRSSPRSTSMKITRHESKLSELTTMSHLILCSYDSFQQAFIALLTSETALWDVPTGGSSDTLGSTAKVQGSHADTLVGTRGLEPPTSAV